MAVNPLPENKPVPQGMKGSLAYPLKRVAWEASLVLKAIADFTVTLLAVGVLYDKVMVTSDENWSGDDALAVFGLSFLFMAVYRRVSRPGGVF